MALASPLLVSWCVCAVGNLGILVVVLGSQCGLVKLERGISFIGIVGGIAGGLGALVWPAGARWAWLPPLLDVGTLPLLLVTLAAWLQRSSVRAR